MFERDELVMRREESERIIKKALLNDLLKLGDEVLVDIVEWLWDNYGIKARREKKDVEKKILRSKDISSRELAVFMLDKGVKINEELWFAELRKNVQDNKQTTGK